MSSSTILTDAGILADVIGVESGDYDLDVARAILRLRFSDAQNDQMRQLAEKNNSGELTSSEREEIESYRRVGNVLALIQAKARLSLQHADESTE